MTGAEQDHAVEMARAFYASPVAGAKEWVETGKAPPRAEIRMSRGFRYTGDPLADCAEWESGVQLSIARDAFIALCGFSIPCAEAVDALLALGPLVEIGAGTGYWTRLLREAGADIIGTDAKVEGMGTYRFIQGHWTPLVALDAVAAVQAYPDRAVFCSWPCYGQPWAHHAARHIPVGGRLAMIGEWGGCTGSDGLFRFLRNRFEEEADIGIPQFPGLHDSLTIHRRVK